MTQGIYAITNKLNGKVYIGSSKNIEKRIASHKALLKSGKSESPKLQKAWIEHGADAFEFSILREIEESISLVEIEQEFIVQYKAWQDYNTRNSYLEPTEKDKQWKLNREMIALHRAQNAQHT